MCPEVVKLNSGVSLVQRISQARSVLRGDLGEDGDGVHRKLPV